jgi:epoxyqueuosine reductase
VEVTHFVRIGKMDKFKDGVTLYLLDGRKGHPKKNVTKYALRCVEDISPADVPFPAWIDPAWHNSIFGCMICQRYCPEDNKVRDWVETRAEFTQEETAVLLNDPAHDVLPVAIMEKLNRLELAESLDTLPRNLGVLLNRE